MTTMFTGNQIIADIEFDAVTSEAHSMEATATQYAVDGGGKVSDHVTVLPDGLEIRGGISNADGGERARTLIAELRRKLRARELLDVLDPNVFKQIHRSTIVNLKAIAGITRDDSGRGIVRLRQRPETLTVSQPFMGLFKHM